MQTALLVLLGLLVAYLGAVVWLLRTGRLERWNLSLMLGVVLMVRTQKGKRLIDAIARPRRLWNAIGDLGIVLTLVGMLLMTAFFFFSVWFVLQPDSGVAPLGVNEILVIPGVNPYVPLWYGLIALAFTLIVHEGGHGVLARANQMKLKSLGLLVAVVPIGAFVEPDDLDMKVASRRARLRVFGAGPAVNLGFAALALGAMALLLGSASYTPGVHVASLTPGAPAASNGITVGDTIASIDGEPVPGWDAFAERLGASRPGQHALIGLADGRQVNVTYTSYFQGGVPTDEERRAITAGERMEWCNDRLEPDPATGGECAERLQDRAFVGIGPFREGDAGFMEHPFGRGGRNLLNLIALPLAEVRGQEPFLGVYLPAFMAAPWAPPVFWGLVAVCFWVFWINLMVGLTNILPMLPLDGGHIFRDAVGGLVQGIRPAMTPERRERVVSAAAATMSIVILAAFVLQIAGPYLVR